MMKSDVSYPDSGVERFFHDAAEDRLTYAGSWTDLCSSDSDLKGVTVSEGNVLGNLENEVCVEILPKEFAERSSLSVSAQDSRAILSEMGYDIPKAIYDKQQLNSILKETPRLSDNDIQVYINRILGR